MNNFYKKMRQLEMAKRTLNDLPVSKVKFRGVDLDEFNYEELKKIAAFATERTGKFKPPEKAKDWRDDIVEDVRKKREAPSTLPEWTTQTVTPHRLKQGDWVRHADIEGLGLIQEVQYHHAYVIWSTNGTQWVPLIDLVHHK